MSLAHKLALASEQITADMVMASEFPHLTGKYHVYGVPKIVINEEIQFEGSRPETEFVAQLMKILDMEQKA